MQKTTLFKTIMNLLESKNISQQVGVEVVKLIIASKSDNEVKRELIKIIEESETEEEILCKVRDL